mmetsp:Transcript_47378/g.120939  ORF Transcript_47378/g.120939 Transcript_47378/m.120939 type:complete len:208 (-) Transcript_47378:897-1520(-)
MPPPIPRRPIGWTMGPANADVKLGMFLDYVCPFSAKQYKALREEVYPAYKDKSFSVTMYHQVQPWHPQGTICHEAGLAVGELSGHDAFFKFSDELFATAKDKFFDVHTFDMTRNDLISKVCEIAGTTGTADPEEVKKLLAMLVVKDENSVYAKNPGSAMTQPLKFHTKFARQNGIHVTPTTMINGLIFDSSSSWGLSEWKEVLDPLF